MLNFKHFNQLLLLENQEDILNFINVQAPRINSGKENSGNTLNKIVRPQGIVIQDTWNNFIFPIQPKPRIDTSKFDIAEVFKRFREMYIDFPSIYLPWHYMIEMVGNTYYVFNTRPIDMKFPLNNQEVLDYKHDFKNKEIEDFFTNKVFQVDNMIHICLVGDTNLDVYPQKLYKLIGTTCVSPFFRDMRINGSFDNRTFAFNIGPKFRFETVIKFARK